jgi:hypothetical protein
MFGMNIDTYSRIYLELSNYRDIVYVPIMDLNMLPVTLYYVKMRSKEPTMTLHKLCYKTKMKVSWGDICMVAHSGKHKDVYFKLPRLLTLPWRTTWTVQNILKGPYRTSLIIRHPYAFTERMKIVLIPICSKSKTKPLQKARDQSKRGSKILGYYDLTDKGQEHVQINIEEQTLEKPSQAWKEVYTEV